VGFSSVLGVFDICQSFRRAYSLPRNPRIRFHFWSFITDFILGKSAFVRKCARNRRCTTRRFHRFEIFHKIFFIFFGWVPLLSHSLHSTRKSHRVQQGCGGKKKFHTNATVLRGYSPASYTNNPVNVLRALFVEACASIFWPNTPKHTMVRLLSTQIRLPSACFVYLRHTGRFLLWSWHGKSSQGRLSSLSSTIGIFLTVWRQK
jgi:hypothetical protein